MIILTYHMFFYVLLILSFVALAIRRNNHIGLWFLSCHLSPSLWFRIENQGIREQSLTVEEDF